MQKGSGQTTGYIFVICVCFALTHCDTYNLVTVIYL